MLYTAELLKATRTAKDSLIVAGKAWDATAKTETLWEIRTKLISAGVDSDDFPPFHAAAIETLLDEVDDRSGCTEGRYDDVLEALVAANDRAQRITSRAAGNGDTTAAPVFLAAVTECQAGSKASETGGNPMLSEVHTFSTILPLFGINETPGTGGGRQPHDHGRGSDAPSLVRAGCRIYDAAGASGASSSTMTYLPTKFTVTNYGIAMAPRTLV